MGLPQLCTADKCMRNERKKKKNISTTKSGTNNWFNWCGAWMRLINTIESVAKHVKQSVKKSDRLVKCYKLFSIHVRPVSVRVEKKRRDTVKYTNLLKSFWIAARKSIEKLDTSDTQMIHAQYFVTNVFAIQFIFVFKCVARHTWMLCRRLFFFTRKKNIRFLCLKFT